MSFLGPPGVGSMPLKVQKYSFRIFNIPAFQVPSGGGNAEAGALWRQLSDPSQPIQASGGDTLSGLSAQVESTQVNYEGERPENVV